MINRINDNNIDIMFENLKNVIDNIDSKKLYKICSNINEAEKVAKQLVSAGRSYDIKNYKDSIYVYSVNTKLVDLREAKQSGLFKKLAWGRYSFQKVNSIGDFQKFNFDDGSIWKVIVDEDGKEYLAKEVVDDNEDEVIRTAGLKKSAGYFNNKIDNSNYSIYVKLIYDDNTLNSATNNQLFNDLLNSEIKNSIFNLLENKFNDIIMEKFQQYNIQDDIKRVDIIDKISNSIKDNSIYDNNSLNSKLIELIDD